MVSARPMLAVDTATEICSVALLTDRGDFVRRETVGQAHSQWVLPMVQAVLADAGLALADCGAIAFGAGPGAFTGLRIACGVAQGLAYGAGLPVVPVGNLEAAAWQAMQQSPSIQRCAVAIDARMNEAYWAVYERDGEALRELAAPALAAADMLGQALAAYTPDAVGGNALTAFAVHLTNLPPRQLPELRADALGIAQLAARALAQGRAVEPALAAPIYIRDRVALTIDERRAAAQVSA